MDFLYEENSVGVFILVTLILGGGAAALTGRAIAGTWRPWWQVIVYALILGGAVRFLHFSLFGGTLLSPHYYLVDSAFCVAFGRELVVMPIPPAAKVATTADQFAEELRLKVAVYEPVDVTSFDSVAAGDVPVSF